MEETAVLKRQSGLLCVGEQSSYLTDLQMSASVSWGSRGCGSRGLVEPVEESCDTALQWMYAEGPRGVEKHS